MPLAPAAPTRSGEPIPGYSLRQRVGAGGYGEVWAAEAPGGLVKAIKFVYGQMDEARAAREFKSLNLIKGVRHPFLLSLERIEVVEGQLLIVSELADESLKERFEKCVKEGQPGIARAELLDHLRDAADALDYMNSQHSLQHLDVKPENLLLVGGRIKVADFGLVKDIHETSGSLMGGLTPIYAPPEVFDARPSRRSDQYSLAIVYQEMLTGQLPFPGKTAAQLAAQHLTAKPRLSSLPAADQPIIEKALSKDPQHRFGSCREMVEALLHNRDAESPHASPASYENGSQERRSTSMFERPSPTALAAYAASTNPLPGEETMFRRLGSATEAADLDSQGRYPEAEKAAEQAAAHAEPMLQQPPASLVDLPPLAVDLTAHCCRRTLFLGVGGLAGKTLQQLRRKIEDRCSSEERENFSFLLLDTDSREIMEATHGQHGNSIRADEALCLPLRKSADYRNDSSKYLDWLSRRWLFNIPRSQQTEGIRPFGRLAFVDHGEEAMRRLRGVISHLTASHQADGPPVRVVLVGASSGGAAGGMLLDVAFAARQCLDEQKTAGEVDLLLLHGTGRQPAAQELAAGNTFALLTELNHYLMPGSMYPGDASCGLKPRPAKEKAVSNLYLAHLGQELGTEQFLAGCDRVAEYLFLDAATATGNYLQACRSAEPREQRSEVTLRTFGLCQIGFSEDVISREVESLCKSVTQGWFGEPKTKPAPSLSARIADSTAESSASPTHSKESELQALAAEKEKSLGLDLDGIVQRLYLLAAGELGGQPDAVFGQIVRTTPHSPNAPPPVDKWFAGSARFFGACSSEVEAAATSPLITAVQKRLPTVLTPLGEQLQEWLVTLPDEPAVRVFGALQCLKLLQVYLKGIGEKAKEMRGAIGGQLSGIEQRLAVAARTPPKTAAKSKDPAALPETLFLQHCQLRLYQAATQLAMQLAQGLASYLSRANDQLQDLARDVKFLANQFTDSEQTDGDSLATVAIEQLQRNHVASVLAVDHHFQEVIFAKAGFRAVLQQGEQRAELLKSLRHQARQAILASLRQIDLSALVMELGRPGEKGKSELGGKIASAQPWLQQVGGERRLVCVMERPDGLVEKRCLSPAELSSVIGSAHFQQLPAVIPAASNQVVFCYELGSVPLAHAAGLLIGGHPQLAQAASRLHARSDVSWQELPL